MIGKEEWNENVCFFIARFLEASFRVDFECRSIFMEPVKVSFSHVIPNLKCSNGRARIFISSKETIKVCILVLESK